LAGHIVDIISSAEYRAKALELLLLAGRTCDGAIRNELLNIALSYVRLADHVDRAASRSEQTWTSD
jgi:hypothetical protein